MSREERVTCGDPRCADENEARSSGVAWPLSSSTSARSWPRVDTCRIECSHQAIGRLSLRRDSLGTPRESVRRRSVVGAVKVGRPQSNLAQEGLARRARRGCRVENVNPHVLVGRSVARQRDADRQNRGHPSDGSHRTLPTAPFYATPPIFVHPAALVRSNLRGSHERPPKLMDTSAIAREMTTSEIANDPAWLARFHTGERAILEQCYRDHFAKVLAAAARILAGVDAETVAQEVFFRLLSDEKTRQAFGGGNLGAWVAKVAANAAIDHHRRHRREVGQEPVDEASDLDTGRLEDELDAKLLVERFRRERLPPKWSGVFEVRFLRQLPQREAALELGMQRSTLAYQESQIRALLSDFLLASEGT